MAAHKRIVLRNLLQTALNLFSVLSIIPSKIGVKQKNYPMKVPSTLIFFFLLSLNVFFSATLHAQAASYDWEWADGFGSPDGNNLDFMELDEDGNVFLLGRFQGDFKRQVYRDLNYQENRSTFLMKYSPSGERLWHKDLNNRTLLTIHALKVDHLGNSYLSGTFREQYIYFMGKQLRNIGGVEEFEDSFLAKISAEGELLWVRQMGILQDDRMTQLALDGMGNVYALMLGTTYMKRTEGYGPQPLVLQHNTQGNAGGLKFTLNGANRRRAKTILKFSTDGEPLWSSELAQNTYFSTIFTDIEADFEGNLYMTGRYQGDVFGDQAYMEVKKIRNLMPEGKATTFLLKMAPNGEVLWVDQFPSTSIEVDEIGNIYCLGGLSGDFINDRIDIGPAFLESAEGENLVFLKYDSEGNFVAYSTFGSTNDDPQLFQRNSEYVTAQEGAIAFHTFNNTIPFDYGWDGNIHLLRRFSGEMLFGKERIMKDGLFLVQFNSNGEVENVAERVNDDIGLDTQNPFIRQNNDMNQRSRISHMRIDNKGRIIIAGHQYDQNLNLGRRLIRNQDFLRNVPGIWLGKLKVK